MIVYLIRMEGLSRLFTMLCQIMAYVLKKISIQASSYSKSFRIYKLPLFIIISPYFVVTTIIICGTTTSQVLCVMYWSYKKSITLKQEKKCLNEVKKNCQLLFSWKNPVELAEADVSFGQKYWPCSNRKGYKAKSLYILFWKMCVKHH